MLMGKKKLTEESEHTKGELYKIKFVVYGCFCVLTLFMSQLLLHDHLHCSILVIFLFFEQLSILVIMCLCSYIYMSIHTKLCVHITYGASILYILYYLK
ncbi:hypothetical protein N665_0714s0014 [Sinapis alba]|nr:hypothetical protein N665_0714s0014 [Sinapis alba]